MRFLVGSSALVGVVLGACSAPPTFVNDLAAGGHSASASSASSSASSSSGASSSSSGAGGMGGGCPAGKGDCDGNPGNGCETDTQTSLAHCGTCAVGCTNLNGTTSCVGGVCAPVCGAGYGDCDANAGNGCETNKNTDANHCGTCATGCPASTPTCSAGSCVAAAGAPSCQAGGDGLTNCGPSSESCCTSPLVTGGSFLMGRSAAGTDAYANGNMDEQPEHTVTVASFKLDRFEVTVGRFREFVNTGTSTQQNPPAAGAGKDPNLIPADTGWQPSWSASLEATVASLKTALVCNGACGTYPTWTEPAGSNEKRPINYVTWYEAEAFCAWDGGWLPTEAEWEYAASGGSDNRYYPWSNPASSTAIDCTYANYNTCAATETNDVGSESPTGDGKYGQADLGGNLREWNLDWYSGGWYSGGGAICSDCADLTPVNSRVVRGGDWTFAAAVVRAASRFGFSPDGRGDIFGFRCARAAP